MKKNTARLELSKEEMQKYGYQIVDAIVEHHHTQHQKFPVAWGSREEMDHLFLEKAPEAGMEASKVLDLRVRRRASQTADINECSWPVL